MKCHFTASSLFLYAKQTSQIQLEFDAETTRSKMRSINSAIRNIHFRIRREKEIMKEDGDV